MLQFALKYFRSLDCAWMSYYIPDLRSQQRQNFRFSLLHKKKNVRGQQPWQILKDRTIGFNIVTPMATWICQNPLLRHSRFTYLLCREGLTVLPWAFFFFLCVDSYIKYMKNSPAQSERACEAEELQEEPFWKELIHKSSPLHSVQAL